MIEDAQNIIELQAKIITVLMSTVAVLVGAVVFMFKRILFMGDREYNSKYDFLKFVNKITGKDHED